MHGARGEYKPLKVISIYLLPQRKLLGASIARDQTMVDHIHNQHVKMNNQKSHAQSMTMCQWFVGNIITKFNRAS